MPPKYIHSQRVGIQSHLYGINTNFNTNCFYCLCQWQYKCQFPWIILAMAMSIPIFPKPTVMAISIAIVLKLNINGNINTNYFQVQYQCQWQYQLFQLPWVNTNVQSINTCQNLSISMAMSIVPKTLCQLSMAITIPQKLSIPMVVNTIAHVWHPGILDRVALAGYRWHPLDWLTI